ncbi:hypothetical protein DAY19_14140 [Halobacteriovorax vibrionivorans]|uniref:Iron-containing redox enzyme family protein n=1 Tax=Halobacteriovorax vibrionivorans TaxID=2152716 RepID=A0ABY0IDT9_9BACT|nr:MULTISPECIES: iron-containing redox enzyme family protein [Halobacteriovorax]RZF21115.1 hypothetical protein DAY19_14140 [Halobacteriovorax vibrionivorans]TGD46999.1 hypothetical protein EP118_09515 [Halobacteriovorax sp. Y22]
MSKLKKLVDNEVAEMIDFFMAANLESREVYANWLAQTYFYTSSSEDILLFCAEKSKKSDMAKRWLEHADEEAGHENLALGDLKRLGFKIENFIEFEETKLFYQSQFFLAQKYSGESVLGWVLILEAFAASVPKEYIDKLISIHGKPATRFMFIHSNEDVEHVEKAYQAVEKLDNLDLIIENIKMTKTRYLSMLKKCNEAKNIGFEKAA